MNTIHLYDAYMLRELNRRSNYDALQVTHALECLRKPTISKILCKDKLKKLMSLQGLFDLFKQPSVVALEYIDESNVSHLSDKYRNTLIAKLTGLLNHERFEIINVHDSFKCLPNHVNAMKLKYNQLLRETYLGEWIYATLDKLTGSVVHRHPINMKTADEILLAQYSIG